MSSISQVDVTHEVDYQNIQSCERVLFCPFLSCLTVILMVFFVYSKIHVSRLPLFAFLPIDVKLREYTEYCTRR